VHTTAELAAEINFQLTGERVPAALTVPLGRLVEAIEELCARAEADGHDHAEYDLAVAYIRKARSAELYGDFVTRPYTMKCVSTHILHLRIALAHVILGTAGLPYAFPGTFTVFGIEDGDYVRR
jgi:hypothetical protein